MKLLQTIFHVKWTFTRRSTFPGKKENLTCFGRMKLLHGFVETRETPFGGFAWGT